MTANLLRTSLAAALPAGLAGIARAVDAPPPPETLKPPAGWTLAWADEFDVDGLPDSCAAFHRYQMLWTDSDIRFGIDGIEHLAYPRLDAGAAGAARAWPFDGPQFLLLDVAIGGDLGGPVDDSIFPVTMEVDYVRVHQEPKAG